MLALSCRRIHRRGGAELALSLWTQTMKPRRTEQQHAPTTAATCCKQHAGGTHMQQYMQSGMLLQFPSAAAAMHGIGPLAGTLHRSVQGKAGVGRQCAWLAPLSWRRGAGSGSHPWDCPALCYIVQHLQTAMQVCVSIVTLQPSALCHWHRTCYRAQHHVAVAGLLAASLRWRSSSAL